MAGGPRSVLRAVGPEVLARLNAEISTGMIMIASNKKK